MLLPGAKEQGMTPAQCVALLEQVEDTLGFFIANLSYCLHAEAQRPHPNQQLIAHWETLRHQADALDDHLPGARVEVYQQVLETYQQHHRELEAVVVGYRGEGGG